MIYRADPYVDRRSFLKATAATAALIGSPRAQYSSGRNLKRDFTTFVDSGRVGVERIILKCALKPVL